METGRNICRVWFFKTINVLIVSACVGIVFTVLIVSACVGIVFTVLIYMHGENNIKCINAQPAGLIYKYHNIKQKLQRANASILFNKVCRVKQLQPIYVNIRVNGDNRRNHQTKLAAVKYRICVSNRTT